jgi:hypothetical protein
MAGNSEAMPEAFICPLCGNNNACMNTSVVNPKQACWCANPALKFPKALLDKLPEEARGKACICQACVEAYHKTLTTAL